MASGDRRAAPVALRDLLEADEADLDDEGIGRAIRVRVALDVVADVRAGLPGTCPCAFPRCKGPASHWTRRGPIPSTAPTAWQNERRRADNVARLETLAFVVEVLEELGESAPMAPADLEEWIRARWLCPPIPDTVDAVRAWARAHAFARVEP